MRRLPDEKLRRLNVRSVEIGIAGDDAVVIAGKSLRLGDGLASAGGAAVEIRMLRGLPVITRSDGLRRDRHLMHGPIGEIGQLLRMTRR